jgi:hypothetical protein
MNQNNLDNLLDLIEDIRKVEEMIRMHELDHSILMLKQYRAKKDELFCLLIDELLKPELRGAKSFDIIRRSLAKYYPNLSADANNDLSHLDLDALMAKVS